MATDELFRLPTDLPVPTDDGAAAHLVGLTVPPIALPSTNGPAVRLDHSSAPLTVVYCYPRTGQPGAIALGNPDDWNAIPGARGCTPQSCGYRDQYAEFTRRGARVFGLSTQTSDYQREAANRLHLPFALLSDAEGRFSNALRLPTFTFAGERLLKRLTFIVERGVIWHCIYPVFPPDKDAHEVLGWLRRRK